MLRSWGNKGSINNENKLWNKLMKLGTRRQNHAVSFLLKENQAGRNVDNWYCVQGVIDNQSCKWIFTNEKKVEFCNFRVMKYLWGILALIVCIMVIVQLIIGIIEVLPTIVSGFVIIGVILLIYYLIRAIRKDK